MGHLSRSGEMGQGQYGGDNAEEEDDGKAHQGAHPYSRASLGMESRGFGMDMFVVTHSDPLVQRWQSHVERDEQDLVVVLVADIDLPLREVAHAIGGLDEGARQGKGMLAGLGEVDDLGADAVDQDFARTGAVK